MKHLFVTIALSISLASVHAFAGPKTVILGNTEKYKNEVRFVSDAPLEKIQGTAREISGTFSIDVQNVAATTGTFTVPVRSMVTGSSSRDSHMYDADWLDADAFKNITYNLKSVVVEKTDNSTPGRTVITGTAKGDFTLRGVSKPMDARIRITYLSESAQTRAIASGDLVLVNAEFSVPLKAHGVKGKGNIVGTKVGESIAINAQLFGTSADH
ncbi:MAG: YceI family protein [Candidatus Kapaibacterium sp.]